MSSFAEDVIRLMLKYDATDELCWSVVEGELEAGVICNDLFHWATADMEPITHDTLGELQQAYEDATTAGDMFYGDMIYASRHRKMRPQGAAYPRNTAIWPLLDACGPARPTDKEAFGNPYEKPVEEPVA